MFNPANGPFVPILRAAGIRTAVHFDGLDAERAKWGRFGPAYFREAERWSVWLADDVIANSEAIAAHIRRAYGREATYSRTAHRSCRLPRIDCPSLDLIQGGSISSSPASSPKTTSQWSSTGIACRAPHCR